MNQMAVPTQNIYNICSVFKNIIAWSQLQKDFLFVCFKLWSKRKLTEVILTGQWQWLGIIHRERLRVTDLHGCLPEGRRRPRGGSWAQPGWRRCCSRMTCSWSTSTGWAGLEDSIVKHINTDGYAKALRCSAYMFVLQKLSSVSDQPSFTFNTFESKLKKKIYTDNQLCTNPKLHELLELSLSLSTNTEHGNYKTGAINSFFRKANSSYSLVTSGNHSEQLCFFGLEEPKLTEWILWIFDLVSKFGVKHSQTSQNASLYIYC